MKSYNQEKWKNKRSVILKRDSFKCVECSKRGISKKATMVHHINPSDKYPELFYENKNLISLCNECHNSMHDRNNKTLSELGRKYQLQYYNSSKGNKMVRIKFIVGAPCSGKSTYVKNNMGKNDIVFDYDELSKAMTNCNLHDNNPNIKKYLSEFRKTFLKFLEIESDFDTAWIITTKIQDYYYEYALYDPEIIQMDSTKEECISRLHNNPDGRNVDETLKVIEEFYGDS